MNATEGLDDKDRAGGRSAVRNGGGDPGHGLDCAKSSIPTQARSLLLTSCDGRGEPW